VTGLLGIAPVPFVDLTRISEADRTAIHEALDRVLNSGRMLLGAETEALEAELAAFSGLSGLHGLSGLSTFGGGAAVAVSSGTEALRLTLTALGIGPGDEVVVPAMTAVPTAAAVCAVGAVPVPADVDAETALLDPISVKAAVGDATRAIVPVHLYGRPLDIEPLLAFDVPIVEDAAQAHGAVTPRSGSAAVCYSFYPTKNVGGIGDGGAVVTDDAALADEIRLLRAHGVAPDGAPYHHVRVATNARLSEFEAAVLRLRLRQLPGENARRAAIAARYRAAAPTLRWSPPHGDHVHHLCVLRIADGRRDEFRAAMASTFATAVHYPLALTDQPAYRLFNRVPCPNARGWAADVVSLPCHGSLRDDEIDRVCDGLAGWERATT
jgi:dTDP-3-amino-3,4,6-trideoxy-alpha-D-glucose transaminase